MSRTCSRAADVDGDNRARPLHHHRDYIAHAEEVDLLARHDLFRREPGHRDVQIAAAQRRQQQKHRGVWADAHAHISQTQGAYLDPRHQHEKNHDQQGEMLEAERQILKSVPVHIR